MKAFPLAVIAVTHLYCVSSARYESLEKENTGTRERLAAVSTDLEQKTRDFTDVETRLKNAEAERDSARKELLDFKAASKVSTDRAAVERTDLAGKLEASAKTETALKERAALLEQTVQKLQAEKQAAEKNVADLQKQIAELKGKPSKTIEQAYSELVSSLRGEVESGDIKIEQINNQLRLSVAERVFFLSGSARVSDSGQEVLKKLAQSLRNLKDKDIFVEGHTDSVSIGSALIHRFPTNWELGAARAVSVVRFLSEQNGLEASRLSAVSHGSNRPIADNGTEEGRARNRRIEITILESTPFNTPDASDKTPSPEVEGQRTTIVPSNPAGPRTER